MSSENKSTHLFKSKQHLIEILHKYRSKIFTDVEINEDLIQWLSDFFILKNGIKRFDENVPVGNIFILKFLDLFSNNFLSFDIESFDEKPIGNGSYARVYKSKKKDEVIKIVRCICEDDDNDNKKRTLNRKKHQIEKDCDDVMFTVEDVCKNRFIFQFIVEFFTYVLWSTIFKYSDDLESKESKKCDEEVFDYLLEEKYSTSMCEIIKPFIVILPADGDDDNDVIENPTDNSIKRLIKDKNLVAGRVFCIGYIMKKYSQTFEQALLKTPDTQVFLDLISAVLIMFHTLGKLTNKGVYCIHRDMSCNNIMLDTKYNELRLLDTNVKMIDFGFSLTSIRFEDERDVTGRHDCWNFGLFFNRFYNNTINVAHDVILFVLFLVIYHKKLLQKCNLYVTLKSAIQYDKYEYLITDNSESLWLYPYRVKTIDRGSLLMHIIKCVDDYWNHK